MKKTNKKESNLIREDIEKSVEKEPSQINVKGEERFPTEAERLHIMQGYEKFNRMRVCIFYFVAFIIFALISVLWGCFEDMQEGIIVFVGLNLFLILFLIKQYCDMKYIVKKIKADNLYVKEAVYRGSTGKYSIAYLEMIENGKKTYKGYNNVSFREEVSRGEKVIVLSKRGKPWWIYKARN